MNETFSDDAADLLLRYEKSLDCVHCGLCLPRCPTYETTGDETASPRGRIYLMRAVAEGRLELSKGFAHAMETCLVCRACEEVCPSGVQFNRMMEVTREELARKRLTSSALKNWLLQRIIPSRKLIAVLMGLLRVYQLTGLPRLARALRIAPRLHSLLPELPSRADSKPLPEKIPRHPDARDRGTVAFLSGCIAPSIMGDVNRATIDALTRAGHEVLVPKQQTCCGALHSHSGDRDTARALARLNLDAFTGLGVTHVVVNAAGCGAALLEYPELERSADAQSLARQTIDVLALLHQSGHQPKGLEHPTQVVYDEPCHLINVGDDAAPVREMIERIPNANLVALPGCNDCCGAAGIYNITHAEMSDAILQRKLDQLEATDARILLTGNPGCLLQWRRGVAERGLDVSVLHPVSLM